jgi:hypothetical protein
MNTREIYATLPVKVPAQGYRVNLYYGGTLWAQPTLKTRKEALRFRSAHDNWEKFSQREGDEHAATA